MERISARLDLVSNDIGKLSDEENSLPDNKSLVAFLITLNHIRDPEWLGKNLAWLVSHTSKDRSGWQKVIVSYTLPN